MLHCNMVDAPGGRVAGADAQATAPGPPRDAQGPGRPSARPSPGRLASLIAQAGPSGPAFFSAARQEPAR